MDFQSLDDLTLDQVKQRLVIPGCSMFLVLRSTIQGWQTVSEVAVLE